VEKVLVCLLAKTRAHRLTFASFKRHVLDELNADLALALTIDESYDYANPYWQHARYRWTAPDYEDYGDAFDLAQRWLCHRHNVPAANWRSMLRIKGLWQGRIRSPDPQPSASSILLFCRWLLLHGLQEDGVLDHYDRYVITRSDFVWLCPHPPLSILDRGSLWFPDGENNGGHSDRHLVVSRTDVANCLNVIHDVLLHPEELYEEMKHRTNWNIERFLAHHLGRKGLLDKVKVFPFVMYSARPLREEGATWSPGRYEPAAGHYIKYDNEYRLASAYATVIRSRADWEQGAWRQFDPATAPQPALPLPRRLRFALDRAYHKVISVLRSPDRVGRVGRYCKRLILGR
jgi:hypothetical protein